MPRPTTGIVEVDGKQHLVNDAGTGNTLRCDHPATQRLVIDSLRYWVEEMGVSGFRFDLAPILGREPGFNPERRNAQDDQDRSGAEQGASSSPSRGIRVRVAISWASSARNSASGTTPIATTCARSGAATSKIGALAGKVAGSAEIFNFAGRKPTAGVNLLAVHDGFTLADLVCL